VRSMEEAVEWVKRCPSPHEGDAEIEIRQVFEAEDFGSELTPELTRREKRCASRWLPGSNGPRMFAANSRCHCRICDSSVDISTELGFIGRGRQKLQLPTQERYI
jgi:hypothetical protein